MAHIDDARKTFDKFDRNGDGYVTPTEFQQAMLELGDLHHTVSLAEAIVRSRDGDGDGVLSFEEFYDKAKEL